MLISNLGHLVGRPLESCQPITWHIKKNVAVSCSVLLGYRNAWLGRMYEGWNFNFGNAAETFDTAHYRVHIFTDPRCTPQSYIEHVPSDEGVA